MKKLIAKYPELWKLFKFGLVGVLNTLVDFIVYTVLVSAIVFFKENAALANVISYTCGLLNSFFFNKHFTFQSNVKLISLQGLKFIVANLITLAISSGIIYLGTDMLSFSNMLSKLIAVPITLIINFLFSRLFVFNEKN